MGLRKFTSKKIGQAIREIRRELNMSQEEFGMAAGSYSQDTVAKWESGQVPHAIVLKSISDLSNPFRSIDSIINGGKPRKRSISKSVGSVADGSQQNPFLRKGRHDDSTVRHQTQKETASSQNPFEILTDQLRVLVREEIQAALKNKTRTIDSPVIPISLNWLREMGLSRQHNRQGNGFKRRNARPK